MSLLKDIDYKQTAEKTDDFLSNKFPHIVMRCGRSLTDLSSPQLSLAPGGSHKTDVQESAIVNGLEMDNIVRAVHHAIYSCSEISQKILLLNYINNYSQNRIVLLLPYERSQYFHVLKPQALVDFADRYDYWQVQCGVDQEDIIDLHVYK